LSHGTYLVRPGTSTQDGGKQVFVLSVRTHNIDGRVNVRHYRIFGEMSPNGKYEWYIAEAARFGSFSALIAHYSKELPISPGQSRVLGTLCCVLYKPLPRTFAPPIHFRDFEVNRDQVRLGPQLGRGSFGAVYRATYCDVLQVAVKTLQPGRMSTAEFIKEAQVMYQLTHPNIVQLLGVCTKTTPVYIITGNPQHYSLLKYENKYFARKK
jgi:hypothetical protein